MCYSIFIVCVMDVPWRAVPLNMKKFNSPASSKETFTFRLVAHIGRKLLVIIALWMCRVSCRAAQYEKNPLVRQTRSAFGLARKKGDDDRFVLTSPHLMWTPHQSALGTVGSTRHRWQSFSCWCRSSANVALSFSFSPSSGSVSGYFCNWLKEMTHLRI